MTPALPPALEARLGAAGLAPRRVLVQNPRKHSLTLLAEEGDGTIRVIKWRGTDAPEPVRSGFQNEAKAYRERYFTLSPTMRAEDDDLIVIDWISGGRSARDGLEEIMQLSRPGVADFLGRVVAAVATMQLEGTHVRAGTAAEFVAALRPVHFSLAASGPISTQRPRWESALTRTLARMVRPVIEQRVRHLVARYPGVLRRGVTHGDLHLDNIVVDDVGRMHVVDLALSRPDGFPAIDLIYASAAGLSMLAHDRRLFREAAREALAQLDSMIPSTAPAVIRIAAELAVVGGANRRFNARGSTRRRQITYFWSVVRGQGGTVEH